MKVVIGLGNPGSKYAGTRHNIGFEVIDYLAQAPGNRGFRTAFQADVAEVMEAGDKVLLMKPQTFMNLSGRAVRGVLDFYKLSSADLLVVCDDFNLPLGKIRVRAKGSHGGQNGLRNIQEQLASDEYPRMRIGVGQPGPGEAIDFVLSRFKPGERKAVDDAIATAANAVLIWLREGTEACMNRANGPEQSNEKRKTKNEKGKPEKTETTNGTKDANKPAEPPK
jgi:peptidyl-tRNA hydrolase, PTH1 family